MNPANFVANHPYQAMLYAFLLTNLIGTMPSPNGTGVTSTAFYKWMFGFLHTINISRILITLFPQQAATIGLLSQADADKEVSQQALSNASKQADKTVIQATKAADAVADAKDAAPKA